MDAETSDVTQDAEMPKEITVAWGNVLVELHANVAQTEEHHTPMEETGPCESNSNAQPC